VDGLFIETHFDPANAVKVMAQNMLIFNIVAI
jgi:3-deoxy-D-manno-octulosonic acid (KDO) 8-phosphate synthase